MKNKKVITFITCSLFILAVTAWIVFKNLALWLIVSDPVPQSLDVIFSFAGDNNRITYSKKLFAANPRAVWVNSDPSPKAILDLAKEGLDTSRIRVVDTCKTTVAEVAFISDWVRNAINGTTSLPIFFAPHGSFSVTNPLRVGLVSSPFHMRRIHLAISRVRKNIFCVIYYLPMPYGIDGFSQHDYKTWWKKKALRQMISLEYFKLFKVLFNL